jgi:tetratricopeptide (TPR) repeat protein
MARHVGLPAYLMGKPPPILARCALVLWFALFSTRAVDAWAQAPAEDANALYAESGAAYKVGHFADAARLLERAYQLSHSPVLLYNLARAYEGMGELEKAASAYERYLKEEPNPPDRGAIQARVTTFRSQLDEQRVIRAQRDEERARAERERAERDRVVSTTRRRSPSAWPWIVAGFGVAAGLGTGVALGEVGLSRHSDAAADTQGASSAGLQGQAQSFATAATVAFVSGGIVTAAGITWGVVDLITRGPKVESGEQRAFTIDLGPRGATLRGTF